jgi:hypothetical protein
VIIQDFDDFKSELKQLCAVIGKTYTDAMGQGYWRVLKDVEFREVKANVDRILKSATKDTKFPRPCDLQDHGPGMPRSAETEGALKQAEERCIRNWDERMRKDPELTAIDLKIARTDLMLAREHQGSAVYATALDENYRYREQRRQLLDQRRLQVLV